MSLKTQADMKDMPRNLETEVRMLDAPSTPFTSKLKAPTDIPAQPREVPVEVYKRRGYTGVRDGVDATTYDSQNPDVLVCRPHKVWDNVQVSDFADESTTSSVAKRQHLADQSAKALVRLKHIMESACCGDQEAQVENGTVPNETRGIMNWITPGTHAVDNFDAKYRPSAAQIYTADDLSGLTEDVIIAQAAAAFKARRGGVTKLDMFAGIELKGKISSFNRYQPSVAGYSGTRKLEIGQGEALDFTMDRLVLDTCTIDIHPTAFNMLAKADGSETQYTHLSGFAVDMDMHALNFIRAPRVLPQENKGGGKRAIVDGIFQLRVANPLSSMAWKVGDPTP